LRALFCQYQHSVWYAGRSENTKSAQAALAQCSLHHGEGSGANLSDITPYEPPRSITAKHVAAVFEKYGYDARNGQKVFNLLVEVLSKLKNERRCSSYSSSSPLELKPESGDDLHFLGEPNVQIHDQVGTLHVLLL
jgi:hypothetical protein